MYIYIFIILYIYIYIYYRVHMDLTILVIELFSEVEHPRRTEPCPEIQSWPPFGYGHCSTSQLVVWSSCSASTASSVLTLCGVGGPRLSRPGCSPPAHWTGHSQDQLFPVRPSVCPPWQGKTSSRSMWPWTSVLVDCSGRSTRLVAVLHHQVDVFTELLHLKY